MTCHLAAFKANSTAFYLPEMTRQYLGVLWLSEQKLIRPNKVTGPSPAAG